MNAEGFGSISLLWFMAWGMFKHSSTFFPNSKQDLAGTLLRLVAVARCWKFCILKHFNRRMFSFLEIHQYSLHISGLPSEL